MYQSSAKRSPWLGSQGTRSKLTVLMQINGTVISLASSGTQRAINWPRPFHPLRDHRCGRRDTTRSAITVAKESFRSIGEKYASGDQIGGGTGGPRGQPSGMSFGPNSLSELSDIGQAMLSRGRKCVSSGCGWRNSQEGIKFLASAHQH